MLAAHSLIGLGPRARWVPQGPGEGREISASVLGTTCPHSPGSPVSCDRVSGQAQAECARGGRGCLCREQLPLPLTPPQGLGAAAQGSAGGRRAWTRAMHIGYVCICAFTRQSRCWQACPDDSTCPSSWKPIWKTWDLARGSQAQHFWGWFPLELPRRDAGQAALQPP